MSLSSAPVFPFSAAARSTEILEQVASRRLMAATAWHSLLWLVVANCVGVLLAAMLVVPSVNSFLGPLTYGRWMPVHMNLQLYGWCSLPLVGFLFEVYGCRREAIARWASPILWLWSAALGIGAISWLNGQSSGCLLYTSPSPRDRTRSRMPSSA